MTLREILRKYVNDKKMEDDMFDDLSHFISGCVQHTRDQVRGEIRRSMGIEDEVDRCPRTGFGKDGGKI
jgi:hypothetical protein